MRYQCLEPPCNLHSRLHSRRGYCGLATVDGGTWYLCWDRAPNAKHLLWAALQVADSRTDLAGALAAFVESVTDFTPEPSRARIERIAAKCGVKVRWVDP